MKKKSKILNKLFTVFVAVLCMAMLCVPAFASSGEQGDLVEILPECQPTYNEDEGCFVLEANVNVEVGKTYIINWNGTDYDCVAIEGGQMGTVFGDISAIGGEGGNGEPFCILVGDGLVLALALDGSTELTISIYQVVNLSDALFSNITSMVDSSIGWIGQFVEVVTSNALLLCFCIVIFVGVGIGLIARIKR